MSGFQTTTTVQPAIGVEGDFSSANPRFSVISGAGAQLLKYGFGRARPYQVEAFGGPREFTPAPLPAAIPATCVPCS